MARTTRSQVEGIFKLFIQDIDGEIATSYKDVGKYWLEYSSPYGYTIERISNENGAVSHPFGSERRKAEEMWYTLHFAIEVLRQQRENHAI